MSRKQKYKQLLKHPPAIDFTFPFHNGTSWYHFRTLADIPFQRVEVAEPGWYACRYQDQRLEVLRPAEPWERNECLSQYAPFPLILVQPLPTPGWWEAMPSVWEGEEWVYLNKARFTMVTLVEDGRPFEQIIARNVPGCGLMFDDLDRTVDPFYAEYLREALAAKVGDPGYDALTPPVQLAYAHLIGLKFLPDVARDAIGRLEDELRRSLALANAELISIDAIQPARRMEFAWLSRVADLTYRITWEYHRQRGTAIVDQQLNVLNAGICLSGRDKDFDLTTVIGVLNGRTHQPAYFHGYTTVAAE